MGCCDTPPYPFPYVFAIPGPRGRPAFHPHSLFSPSSPFSPPPLAVSQPSSAVSSPSSAAPPFPVCRPSSLCLTRSVPPSLLATLAKLLLFGLGDHFVWENVYSASHVTKLACFQALERAHRGCCCSDGVGAVCGGDTSGGAGTGNEASGCAHGNACSSGGRCGDGAGSSGDRSVAQEEGPLRVGACCGGKKCGDVRFVAVGDGAEEEAAAATMGWPFVRVLVPRGGDCGGSDIKSKSKSKRGADVRRVGDNAGSSGNKGNRGGGGSIGNSGGGGDVAGVRGDRGSSSGGGCSSGGEVPLTGGPADQLTAPAAASQQVAAARESWRSGATSIPSTGKPRSGGEGSGDAGAGAVPWRAPSAAAAAAAAASATDRPVGGLPGGAAIPTGQTNSAPRAEQGFYIHELRPDFLLRVALEGGVAAVYK
eukprot:4509-Chlamydomonas_euryale.AAC.1